MHRILIAFLMAASISGQPLVISAHQERDALMVDFVHVEALPETFVDALPSGAVVRLAYEIQLRSDRRLMWDRRVWRGELVVTAFFDPVTGRFRCQSVLDDVIVASEEFSAIDEVQNWLKDPPEVRLAMHDHNRWRKLRIRVRAVYSTSTTWLIFPSTDRTEWVELRLESKTPSTDEPASDPAASPSPER